MPGTVTPTGTPDDPNQAGIQRAGTMAENFADKLQGQPTLAETLKPIQAQRTLPPQEYDPAHPEYKPSPGRRFMRGLEAVGEGVARRGIMGGLLGGLDPAAVGATPYSAPTREFSIAAKKQAAQQGSLDQQAATAEKAFTADTGRAKDIITSINDIGKNYAAGQNAQARMDTAAARADTARVAGQLADIKQQVADYQSQGRVPTTYEATVAAAALEKDPARKKALSDAANTMASTELKKFQYNANSGPSSVFRDSAITKAKDKITALQDEYQLGYDPTENMYYSNKNPKQKISPDTFADRKMEIVDALNQSLAVKHLAPIDWRPNRADIQGTGQPSGDEIKPGQAPAQPAATPQAAAKPTTQAKVSIKDGGGQVLSDKTVAKQYLDAAGGDKDKARALAQNDHWKLK